jgi:hypothetical protein
MITESMKLTDAQGHCLRVLFFIWPSLALFDQLNMKTSPQPNATQKQPEQNTENLEETEMIEIYGGPGQSRTADLRFRKPLLYPSELQGRAT